MKYNLKLQFLIYSIIGTGIGLLIISYFFESIIFLFIGIAVVVGGVLFKLFIDVVTLFKSDQTLDILKLKESGLTIVTCKSCLKENVLEDKYCIYCQEELESEQNEL